MLDLDNEIDQVAETMEKSVRAPKEVLFDTIRELGPEAIRAKLPLLEKSEKELLVSVLEEMKKAVEMDSTYAAKYVQGKAEDTIIQEDKADDDQDEKNVKAEAAKMDHQGTPTPGWEGQVIKGKEVMKKEDAKDAIMALEEKEHKTKDPKKLVEAEKKEHGVKKCMKKSDVPFKKIKSGKKDEMKDGLKEIKKSVEEQLKEFGLEATPELVKSEMKRLLAEESQDGDAPKMDEKTRANKESVEALNLAADSKAAQKKVDDEKQGMKKSAPWADENALLKANTFGRNYTFSLEEYVKEVQATMNKPAEEPMAKSEKKEDLNDIIEKGQDTTWDNLKTDRMVKANVINQRGSLIKSFADDEIAQALGLTPEEAEKILGKK